MKIPRVLYLSLVVVGMCLSLPVNAQNTRSVVLRFRKAGDTVAVRSAQLTIDHTIEAVTDSAGEARIPDLEDGGHIVEAVAPGYEAYFDNFVSGAGMPMPLDLAMKAFVEVVKPKGQPTELLVTGFEQRRALGQGQFFTLEQLTAAAGRPLANFLKVDAGAFIVPGPHNESYLALGAKASAPAPCYSVVVRDGLRVYPFEGASPPNLDLIFTDDLAGIEIYSATVPAELRDVSSCGALVLWSR